MKAITCPQCGAIIRKIPDKDLLAVCDYCEAKIILPDNKEKIAANPDEKAEKKLTPWEEHQENLRQTRERASRYDAPYTYPEPENKSPIFLLVFGFIGIMLFIIFAANAKSCLSRPPV